MSSISTPAFSAATAASEELYRAVIAPIFIASVITMPSNPISFLSMSVIIIFDNVAGVLSPVTFGQEMWLTMITCMPLSIPS